MSVAAISAKDLVFSYNGVPAVDGFSLSIQPGESFGLLGPNGAGKSTTINMLVGLLKPNEGSVEVFGGDPSVDQTRQKIGVSPQSLSLYQELSAEENLDFFGRMYGLNGEELKARVDDSLQISGLTDRRKDRVKTFSGGMKRRLNIATALIHQPQILLLDEPTVGVDPQSRNHIFESIERMKREGLTILYTTHYMEEAERLCDSVAIMDHGKILAVDQTDQLIQTHGGESWIELECSTVSDFEVIRNLGRNAGWRDPIEDRLSIKFPSGDTQSQMRQLLESEVAFRSLQIKRPDLENVFLNLTGRSLRD